MDFITWISLLHLIQRLILEYIASSNHTNIPFNINWIKFRDRNINLDNSINNNSFILFNSENEDFRPCYETCATCDKGGAWDSNNCLTCKNNYIPKPDINPTSDCVLNCGYYYYYSSSNQYKCTQGFYCPFHRGRSSAKSIPHFGGLGDTSP